MKRDRLKTVNLSELEKLAIIQAIEDTDGNILHACELLGISSTTIYRKMKLYGIELKRETKVEVNG